MVINLPFKNYNKNYGLTHYMWICVQINENMLEYKLVEVVCNSSNFTYQIFVSFNFELLGCSI
jgi:hypothetical protein